MSKMIFGHFIPSLCMCRTGASHGPKNRNFPNIGIFYLVGKVLKRTIRWHRLAVFRLVLTQGHVCGGCPSHETKSFFHPKILKCHETSRKHVRSDFWTFRPKCMFLAVQTSKRPE
ncbi:hypothetical protein PVAND_003649 [Polypedilum vanderplanki]|uniref:Uncharacterized protein n=1 Tax=Polypedilum vanderplanki TaxID=319348 RepID=A0A9J6BUQ2_POLVA|nr:hypothetical protein PVAND_003649 [Polypedilum vanderplanki]